MRHNYLRPSKEETLNITTTKPHNSTSRGAKNEMSHEKPTLANHIMRFICTTFRFGKYFAGSTQTAVLTGFSMIILTYVVIYITNEIVLQSSWLHHETGLQRDFSN